MKNAKKWLCIFLTLTLFGCLCACTDDKSNVTEQSTASSETTAQEGSSDGSDEGTTSAEASSADTEDTDTSEETQPSDTTDDVTFADSSTDSSVSEESQPADSSIPDESQPADSSIPDESQPADSSTPDESQPADSSTPDESQPADSSDPDTNSDVPPDESSKEPDESGADPGAQDNPLTMAMGNNSASIKGNGECYYSWIATEDATLALQFSGAIKTGWTYQVDNLTAGAEFAKNGSSSDGSDSNVYLVVFKGDKIQIAVNTVTGAAGNVTFNASLLEIWGTDSNPMTITVGETNYLRVPAGGTVYFCGRTQNTTMELSGASDSVLEFDGESYQLKKGKLTLEMPKSEGGRAEVLRFAIKNNTKNMQVYSVTCDYPKGTSDNPAEVKLGSNSVQIEAGNQYGYVYEWTATAKGTVTITMTGSNWHYEILNINTMVQEQSNSGEDTPVKETTITVKKGQVVRITINTGDGKAAKVTFNFSFE